MRQLLKMFHRKKKTKSKITPTVTSTIMEVQVPNNTPVLTEDSVIVEQTPVKEEKVEAEPPVTNADEILREFFDKMKSEIIGELNREKKVSRPEFTEREFRMFMNYQEYQNNLLIKNVNFQNRALTILGTLVIFVYFNMLLSLIK